MNEKIWELRIIKIKYFSYPGGRESKRPSVRTRQTGPSEL